METYEVHPRAGLGPFRLGMSEDEVVELQNRLFPGVYPGSYCRTEYLAGRLAGIGLLANENRQILYGAMELTHVHVEELISRLAQEAEFICDCVDPELAWHLSLSSVGAGAVAGASLPSKLLDNPEFQKLIQALPEKSGV